MINSADTAESRSIDSLPSNNNQLETNGDSKPDDEVNEEKTTVSIDPVTGEFQQQLDDLGISKEMADMLEISPEDLLDIPESISDIDKQLYQKYGLSDDEINFIETHVKEMA